MTGPYGYTSDPTVITQLILDKIEAAKATFRIPVIDTYYGDQDRILHTPSICVETGEKQRALHGTVMTENEFLVYILVYHNKVQGNELTRKECDMIGYDVEMLLHQDLQLKNGGTVANVIHGYVQSHESGYTFKQNTMYRSARLTWHGLNKTSLPVA